MISSVCNVYWLVIINIFNCWIVILDRSSLGGAIKMIELVIFDRSFDRIWVGKIYCILIMSSLQSLQQTSGEMENSDQEKGKGCCPVFTAGILQTRRPALNKMVTNTANKPNFKRGGNMRIAELIQSRLFPRIWLSNHSHGFDITTKHTPSD